MSKAEAAILVKLTGTLDDIELALDIIADLQSIPVKVKAFVMKKDGTEVHISANEEAWLKKIGHMENLVTPNNINWPIL